MPCTQSAITSRVSQRHAARNYRRPRRFCASVRGRRRVEQSSVKILLRDFDMSGLDAKERCCEKWSPDAGEISRGEDRHRRQRKLQEHERGAEGFPQLTENAMEAARGRGSLRRSSRFAAEQMARG